MVTAQSGKAIDIQAGVNLANNNGDTEVLIPEGTFNFVDNGGWNDYSTKVTAPAGISIKAVSAPTLDAYGRPETCKTILQLPYNVPSGSINSYDRPLWFSFIGNGNASLPKTQFSGLKLVGYRSVLASSVYILNAVSFWQVMNLRLDHCILENVVGGCVADGGNSNIGGAVPDHQCCGVFDHNKLINTIGYCDAGMYDNLSVCYGVQPFSFNSNYWDPNIDNIWGKYTPYSIYIEDNLFTKWRHCISAGSGIHAVFRHNLVENDYANGSVDVHGQGLSYLGGRCLEIYSNTIRNAVDDGGYGFNGTYYSNKGWTVSNNRAINFRGGAGIIYDNDVDATYTYLAEIIDEEPSHLGGYVEDLHVWGNRGTTTLSQSQSRPVIASKPANWTAYTYPHPLVEGVTPPPNPVVTLNSTPAGRPFIIRRVS